MEWMILKIHSNAIHANTLTETDEKLKTLQSTLDLP